MPRGARNGEWHLPTCGGYFCSATDQPLFTWRRAKTPHSLSLTIISTTPLYICTYVGIMSRGLIGEAPRKKLGHGGHANKQIKLNLTQGVCNPIQPTPSPTPSSLLSLFFSSIEIPHAACDTLFLFVSEKGQGGFFSFGGSERGRKKKKKQFVSPSIKKQILGDRILTCALDRKTPYLLLVIVISVNTDCPPPLSPLLSLTKLRSIKKKKPDFSISK